MSALFQAILEQAHKERRWVSRGYARSVLCDGAGLILGEVRHGGISGDWSASKDGSVIGYYVGEDSAKQAVERACGQQHPAEGGNSGSGVTRHSTE